MKKRLATRRYNDSDMINEHDMTKKMLDILRGDFKMITEEEQVSIGSESDPDGTMTPVQGDAIFNDELKKLQTVDNTARIESFKIYPNDGNVIINATLLKQSAEDSGIHFTMNYHERKMTPDMKDVELNTLNSEILRKLQGYYQLWLNEWAIKLTNDYPPKKSED